MQDVFARLEVLVADGESGETEFRKTLARIGPDDRRAVIDHYSARVIFDAADGLAFYLLGLVFMHEGENDHAAECFEAARNNNFAFLDCHYWLAQCRPAHAQSYLERAISVCGFSDEEYLRCKYTLAELHERNGDVRDALHLFQDVYAVHIGYRDVADRIGRLVGGPEPPDDRNGGAAARIA